MDILIKQLCTGLLDHHIYSNYRVYAELYTRACTVSHREDLQ